MRVHGRGLAALAPYVYEASIKGSPHKFAAMSKLLGGKNEYDFVSQIRELIVRLHLTETLGDMGIKVSDVPWLTENCMKISAASIANHPVIFNREEINSIYTKSI